MLNERRLIEIFKNFVERALLPQIKKFDGSIQEWKKFSAMLSQDVINYQELAAYVDALGSGNNQVNSIEKGTTPSFLRNENNGVAFNPSKTFGGERARLAMFQKLDF